MKPSNFIPARRNFLGELLVFWIARRSLYRAFHTVQLQVAQPLPTPPSRLTTPLIFYANHHSWWDGYLAQILMRQVYGLEAYLMMDVQQLRRYRFFSWAGCFSVDRQDGREASRSIDYVNQELKSQPGRALWLFPQGEIRPQEQRPLGFYPGLAHLIKRLGSCYAYPVATRFEFTREQYPEIFIRVGPARYFGAAEKVQVKSLTAELETNLTIELDRLRDDLSQGQPADFVTIIKGKSSTDTSFDQWLKWLPSFRQK